MRNQKLFSAQISNPQHQWSELDSKANTPCQRLNSILQTPGLVEALRTPGGLTPMLFNLLLVFCKPYLQTYWPVFSTRPGVFKSRG